MDLGPATVPRPSATSCRDWAGSSTYAHLAAMTIRIAPVTKPVGVGRLSVQRFCSTGCSRMGCLQREAYAGIQDGR